MENQFREARAATSTVQHPFHGKTWLALAAAIVGPGLMVMLADTDAGSIVTAAQSGARWGYLMILPMIILIPILYLVQEMTVRLGLATHQGHGELIREHFGLGWAVLSVSTLFLSALGALVTEFAGISGVGELFGIPAWLTVSVATVLLIGIGLSGSYRRVERVGIAIGLFEITLLIAAIMARPDVGSMVRALPRMPLGNQDYLFFLSANVGAVIMPWMVFYQQGAVIDKRLTMRNLRTVRLDTFIGSILTQLVMVAVVIAVAATIGQTNPSQPLNDIQQIATALEPFLGWGGARLTFGLGMLGAGFIAALVVSLAGSWGITEALRLPHSLNSRPGEARWFYLVYTLVHVFGAILVFSKISLVALTMDIEVMNAALLPIVLGFLLILEARVLPKEFRMNGAHRYATWLLSGAVIAFGLFIAIRTVVSGGWG